MHGAVDAPLCAWVKQGATAAKIATTSSLLTLYRHSAKQSAATAFRTRAKWLKMRFGCACVWTYRYEYFDILFTLICVSGKDLYQYCIWSSAVKQLLDDKNIIVKDPTDACIDGGWLICVLYFSYHISYHLSVWSFWVAMCSTIRCSRFLGHIRRCAMRCVAAGGWRSSCTCRPRRWPRRAAGRPRRATAHAEEQVEAEVVVVVVGATTGTTWATWRAWRTTTASTTATTTPESRSPACRRGRRTTAFTASWCATPSLAFRMLVLLQRDEYSVANGSREYWRVYWRRTRSEPNGQVGVTKCVSVLSS